MAIEENYLKRLATLLETAGSILDSLQFTFPNDRARHKFRDVEHAKASAWLASACALAEAILPDANAPHRRFIARIAPNGANADYAQQVKEIAAILQAIKVDAQHGIFTSIEDRAAAMGFDNLLDHADEYLKFGHVDVGGVIAGVAFEDAMRRARQQKDIEPEDIAIEALIVAFAKTGVLTGLEAKRARACAGLRDHATHARWAEYKREDVDSSIHFTRQFVSKMFTA